MNGTSYGVRIAGVGHYVPERILSNADLERMLDTSDEWITTRTGIERRRISTPEQAVSDLAIAAAKTALARAALAPNDIDAYIVATVTPDYPFPATAALVATALGAVEKAAFDMEIACSGFVYGLAVASSLIRAGVHRRVMIIGAETLSKITDFTDRSTAILFGDGAGAVIVERSADDSFLGADFGSDGSKPEMLFLPTGGSRRPIDTAVLDERANFLRMRGSETFKFAVTKMVDSSHKVLEQAGLTVADIALLIPHQANKRIIDAAARQLGIAGERVYVNIQDYGNTSAASIPIALSEAFEKKLLHDGDVIVFVAFGGGLSWGAIAWRWNGAA
ncbi:MAG: beta-ketoacyl-ACP synthase III [Candidatus Velthaea sp.]